MTFILIFILISPLYLLSIISSICLLSKFKLQSVNLPGIFYSSIQLNKLFFVDCFKLKKRLLK